jgi:hypothetical protein
MLLTALSARHAAVASLLAASLLIGIAQLAVLPPFEGFDETAHYSYIQEVAETGNWPRYRDPQSVEIDDYFALAPSAHLSGSTRSYADFFAAPPGIVAAGRAAARESRDPSRPWIAGRIANWEAQHPPLYYFVMAPAYLLSKGWSLVDQLLLLRGVSYLFAWLGLSLAVLFTFHDVPEQKGIGPALFIAPAIWPYFFPMWFPEMARLGNDSLVTLIAALAFICARGLLAREGNLLRHGIVGLLCGIGLLTKATFLPFVVALSALFVARLTRGRSLPEIGQIRLRGLAAFLLVVIVVAGWWYAYKFLQTGNLLGANDAVRLSEHGGLIKGLLQYDLLAPLVHGSASLAASFLWAGTWSFMVPSFIATVPLILILLLLGYGYLRYLNHVKFALIDWLPILTLLGFLAGLCYNTLVMIAQAGVVSTPGWYLHSFAPVFSLMLAGGLAGISAMRRRRAIKILMAYPLFFLPLALLVEVQYFSGCSEWARALYINVFANGPCAANFATMWDRLSVLASPTPAIGLFVAGWLLMLIGVLAAARQLVGNTVGSAGKP